MKTLRDQDGVERTLGEHFIDEAEHGCCHEASVRVWRVKLSFDGTEYARGDLVAEFMEREDAKKYAQARNTTFTP